MSYLLKLFGTLSTLLFCTDLPCISQIVVREETVEYDVHVFLIGESTLNDVFDIFGRNYNKKDWSGFSYECRYDSDGISFSYKQADTLKTIYWVNIDLRERLINLEDRVILNHDSVLKDVVDAYGSTSFEYDSTYNGLSIEYEYFDILIQTTEHDLELLTSEEFEYDWQLMYSKFQNRGIRGVEVY